MRRFSQGDGQIKAARNSVVEDEII